MPTTTDQLIQPVKKEQSIHHQEDGEDDDDDSLLMDSAALFIEPEGFRPPPDPPTLKTFERRIAAESGQPQTLDLQLVGQHSLWAHQ